MHNLLIERNAKRIGEPSVAFEGWHSTPNANASFSKRI